MAELGESLMTETLERVEVPPAAGGARPKRQSNWGMLIWPPMIFLAAVFLWPLIRTAVSSLTDPGPENYVDFFTDPVYLRSLGVTFLTAAVVTAAALLIAYPYAYLMYVSKSVVRALLIMLVLFPFFTSLLVRTYAWTVWLQQTGIINTVLMKIGIIDQPMNLMGNTIGVTIGMTHALLPFMVFPIFASMLRIPGNLVPAAMTLGASPLHAFRTVFLPLSKPGVFSGSLMVFVMALGYYVTPALLGSPSNAMLSEFIVNEVEQQLSYGTGSAIGIILLILTLLVLFLGSRVVGFKDVVSGGR
jgi:putative spermidine/putrescine transport system permease protein